MKVETKLEIENSELIMAMARELLYQPVDPNDSQSSYYDELIKNDLRYELRDEIRKLFKTEKEKIMEYVADRITFYLSTSPKTKAILTKVINNIVDEKAIELQLERGLNE